MLIKSSKSYHIAHGCLIPALFLISTLAAFETDSLWAFVFFFCPCAALVMFGWIVVDRTLLLDATGCTICFWKFKKFFKWEELATKEIVYFPNAFSHWEPYISGVIFSYRKRNMPRWLTPYGYSIVNNPFHFFFVYFDPHIQYEKGQHKCDDIYLVDEYKFREKMTEWGVKLEEAI